MNPTLRTDVSNPTCCFVTVSYARYTGPEGARAARWSREMQMAGEDSNNNSSDNSGDDAGGAGTATITKPKTRTKTPSLYRVILMNDDFTPMDFVIHVLQKFFQKEYTEATRIMLQVHQQGAGVCGVFAFEIAEMKVHQVNQYSRENRHPLKCTMERA